MRGSDRNRAIIPALLVCLFLPVSVSAQNELINRIQSGLDGVARGFDYVGKKAEDLIGPGLGLMDDREAEYTESRSLSESYPVSPAPVILVKNEFGSITISAWDDRIVRIDTAITAGADTADLAAEMVRAIDVKVNQTEDHVELRTFLPDTRRDMGFVSMSVNHVLHVPRGASVITENFFGDTAISGINGTVAVENQYGQVELEHIGGLVRVRTNGEFPFRAGDLAAGGSFQLHGASAELAGLGGQSDITASRGSLLIHQIPEESVLDVTSNSCPLRLIVNPDTPPDLSAAILYGNLESSLPLDRSVLGNRLTARNPVADSGQHVSINAAFGPVIIEGAQGSGSREARNTGDTEPFNDILTREEAADGLNRIVIEATTGDVRVEGIAGNSIRITATRIVWTGSASQAQQALDSLSLQTLRKEGRLELKTTAPGDMAVMGCQSWRIDLLVQCPAHLEVSVQATNGLTSLDKLTGNCTATQASGDISATAMAGQLTLSAEKGSVRAEACAGGVKASARYGDLLVEKAGGPVEADCYQGKTVIESPGSAMTVQSREGDVRILALEALRGACNVVAESGNISMIITPEADAALSLKAVNGMIFSTIPLAGSINRDTREFSGQLKDGQHPVHLETSNGDIILD